MSRTARVRVYWRNYGKGRRLRAEWPGGYTEGSIGSAEETVWLLANLKSRELGLPIKDESAGDA